MVKNMKKQQKTAHNHQTHFSAELFSDTRLTQGPPAGCKNGDWLVPAEGRVVPVPFFATAVQRSSREKKPLKSLRKGKPHLSSETQRQKPNFAKRTQFQQPDPHPNSRNNKELQQITPKPPPQKRTQSKPNTNPIRTQYEPNSNPIRTQSEPKTNPIKPNFRRSCRSIGDTGIGHRY